MNGFTLILWYLNADQRGIVQGKDDCTGNIASAGTLAGKGAPICLALRGAGEQL